MVFDHYDMIREGEISTQYKANVQPYSHKHGGYVNFKTKYMLVSGTELSMTITFATNKLPCEFRPYYIDFAKKELQKPGKLWAIQNGTLIWAYAYITNFQELASKKDNLGIDVDFTLHEGIWHKANKQTTFMLKYDICTFFEEKCVVDYKKKDICKVDFDCCGDCIENANTKLENCICCCSFTKEDSLCYNQGELEAYQEDSCEYKYRFVIDCDKGEEFFEYKLGDKICTKDSCSNIIAGKFYSETDMETSGISLKITGKMSDPSITINGNTNVIKGEYDGNLKILANGDVYYGTQDCCEELLDPSVWEIPLGHDYGWKVEQGENRIVIDTGDCCTANCVYIVTDDITI